MSVYNLFHLVTVNYTLIIIQQNNIVPVSQLYLMVRIAPWSVSSYYA